MQKSNNQVIFWGCFIALVTTAFGFIARMFLLDDWAAEFKLDDAEKGRLAGVGIWPFAVSIIGFSLIIDRIGYKTAMIFAFVGHITWAAMGVSAFFISQGGNKEAAYQMLYWGSLILGLANGTVEAFINPVVATIFNNNKPKWLNILHAGWPGGLVVAGMVTIFMGGVDWWIKLAILAVPAVLYFLILLPQYFPKQERESAGVSYKDMLSEFGVLGALVVGFLITLQLMDFFSQGRQLSDMEKYTFIGIGVAIVIGFGLYTMSLGRFLMFFMILIMMPLATTEIGTDSWIESIMKPIAKLNGFNAGWVLVYTSVIMMVLRFFAGPIIKAIGPLGLLTASAALAIVGLSALSIATTGLLILVAATLYGFAKTFFWPTMLGVVSEQMPKGGALTLNAISGIGMLAVGTLGTTYIGSLQANKTVVALQSSEEAKKIPGLIVDGKLTPAEDKSIYAIIKYQAIDDKKMAAFFPLTKTANDKKEAIEKAAKEANKDIKPDDLKKKIDDDADYKQIVEGDGYKAEAETQKAFGKLREGATQGALLNMAVFPAIMLVGYIILLLYFKSKGGYKPVVLGGGAH